MRVYLDYNAGGPVRPEVLELAAELWAKVGSCALNPSSVHAPGRRARTLLTEARREISSLLGIAHPKSAEIIFCSGGTEACNSLLHGFASELLGARPVPIVTSSIEHPAVLEFVKQKSYAPKLAPCSRDGRCSVQEIEQLVDAETEIVALMLVNNETGVIQPVAELAQSLRKNKFRGAILSDITQAVGKLRLNVDDLFSAGVDGVAFSGHKLGAPAGVGVFVLKKSADSCRPFQPLLFGGRQEQGFRAGTENVFGAASLGRVAHVVRASLDAEIARITTLREHLRCGIKNIVPDAICLSPCECSVGNTLLVMFPGQRGDDFVVAFDLEGVSVSTGSACASGKQQASHVLRAMGYSEEEARSAVRFSLGWSTTEAEIDFALNALQRILQRVKSSHVQNQNDQSDREWAA